MSEDRIKPGYALHEPSKGVCTFCGKPVEPHLNYCNWDCHVEHAKQLGGKVIAPNGLPIRCIMADGTMLEDEHGDHPDYKFPVKVEYVGPLTDGHRSDAEMMGVRSGATEAEMRECFGETHALLYTDGCVAVTLFEFCYAFWYLRDGECAGGALWKKTKEWRLSEEARKAILEYRSKSA